MGQPAALAGPGGRSGAASTSARSRGPLVRWLDSRIRGFAKWLVARGGPGEVFSDPTTSHFLRGAVPYGYPPARGSRELLQVAKKNPWLWAATTKVSHSVASVRWMVLAGYDQNGQPSRAAAHRYREARRELVARVAPHPASHRTLQRQLAELRRELNVEPLPDHPLTDILEHPNAALTGFDVRELTQRHLDLVGESFWIIERDTPEGIPARIWPAPNYWVIRTPSPGYPFFDVFYNGIRQKVSERDMIWIRHIDLSNPYARGAGAGQALGDEIETDEYAAKVAKAIFVNGSTPAGIISVETKDQDGLEEMQSDWDDRFGGVLNAFRVAWVSAKAKFVQLTPNFADQGILDLRKAKRDDFRGIYGVPPELLGLSNESSYAHAQAAQSIFATNSLVPRLEFLRNALEHRLVPEYGLNGDEPIVLEYESPVPEDRDFEAQVMGLMPEGFSLNEWRNLAGHAPRDGWDDVFPSQQGGTGAGLGKALSAAVRKELAVAVLEEARAKLPEPQPQRLLPAATPKPSRGQRQND